MIPNKVLYILTDLLPMIILFSVVMISLRIVYLVCSKEKIDYYNDFKMLIYVIYTFILFKLVTTTDFESFSNNFIPFKEISRYDFSSVLFFRNVIGNILLFVPFGYMISDMIKDKDITFKTVPVLLMTLITSFTIEVIQMNIGRSFDIDDIILNFIGGLLGCFIYKIAHIIIDKMPSLFKHSLIKTIIFLIMIIIAILFVFKGV